MFPHQTGKEKMQLLGSSVAFTLERPCVHATDIVIHGRMKLTESRFLFGSCAFLCQMPFFVDGGFQVARGDPSTKACIFRPPPLFCLFCVSPLSCRSLGVRCVFLPAHVPSVVLNEIPVLFHDDS